MRQKKKKINLFKKVFFTLLFGIVLIPLLSSYTYDPNTDTIIGGNLVNNTQNGIIELDCYGYKDPNNNFINDSNGTVYWFDVNLLANEQYTLSVEIKQGNRENSRPIIVFLDSNGNYYYEYITYPQIATNVYQTYNFVFNYNFNIIRYFIGLYAYGGYVEVNPKTMMLNSGDTPLPFEPYGEYVSKDDYEQLEDDYAGLEFDYEQLQSQLDSLQYDYNELSYDYEHLQQNYNTLENNYNNAIDDLDTLRDEFQDLTNQYNSLQQLYNDLKNAYNPMGMIYNNADAYLFPYNQSNTPYYYATSTSNYLAYDEDLEVNDEFNYITPGSFPNIDDYLTEQQNSGISLYWSIRLDNLTNMPFNIVFAYNEVYSVVLYNTFNNNAQTFDVGQNLYLSVNNQQEFEYNVILIRVYQKQWTWTTISTTNYNILYNQGYNDAMNTANDEINRLKNSINVLNNQISSLQEQLSNTLGWRPLFFAMADTPLKVVSSVLGFELFGLNLFQAFIGIITALAIIWLIRKIWK